MRESDVGIFQSGQDRYREQQKPRRWREDNQPPQERGAELRDFFVGTLLRLEQLLVELVFVGGPARFRALATARQEPLEAAETGKRFQSGGFEVRQGVGAVRELLFEILK